ncbi:MAG: TIGR03086 family protein [Actinobacteria bacterium]|nr:TIGR03086 family protein [Actinomycetota bacterium]
MDLLTALHAATDEFGRRLALADDDDWTRGTPCSGWDVHYLAAHVVGGNRFAISILGGMTASAAIEEVMSTSQLGDDPLAAWEDTSVAQLDAFHAAAVFERRVDHPLGEITGREFLEFRVFDITVHAWDLARSIGADDQLDADLVDAVLGIVDRGPAGMGFGIAPLGEADDTASPQARLLDLTGRR